MYLAGTTCMYMHEYACQDGTGRLQHTYTTGPAGIIYTCTNVLSKVVPANHTIYHLPAGTLYTWVNVPSRWYLPAEWNLYAQLIPQVHPSISVFHWHFYIYTPFTL